MKYGKIYIEWQTSIEGVNLSDLGDSVRKREGSFNIQIVMIIYMCFHILL